MLRLLGGFRVEVDGRMVGPDEWRGRRAADLVKLLGLSAGHQVHREQVLAHLWPTLSVEAGGANLRKAVHYARRATGTADVIVAAAGTLSLMTGRDDVWVDVDAFEDAARLAGTRAEAEAAALLYGGDLLPGDAYEDWTEPRRSQLRATYADLLRRAELWRDLLRLDPADESAHQGLMERSLADGNRVAVVRQFETLREALKDAYAVAPGEESVRLVERAMASPRRTPPSPVLRAQTLLARALVAWNRQDLPDAERLASAGRQIAVEHGLGREMGEATTVLAMVADARGRWHQRFLHDFEEMVREGSSLESVVYDSHLCFAEFHLDETGPRETKWGFATELRRIADSAGSEPGQALATLMVGELHLISGELDQAFAHFRRAAELNSSADCPSGQAFALQRLGQVELALGRHDAAVASLETALRLARDTDLATHLVVRVLASLAEARPERVHELAAEAERDEVCAPCSIGFHVQATIANAGANDLDAAGTHLAQAERLVGMWGGGAWPAAVWEARAAVRAARGQLRRAATLYAEAADGFDEAERPRDAERCRASRDSLAV